MTPVREILDRGRRRIAEDLTDTPEIRAELSGTLGTVYNNLGLYDTARELKTEALRLRRAAAPDDRPALAIDANNLARFHYDLGDYATAEPLFREALAIFQRLGDEASAATTLLNLASVLVHLGRYDEAFSRHRQVLEIRRRLDGERSPKVASSLYGLGFLYYTRGDSAAAEPLLRQALDIYIEAYGPEHTRVASVLGSLGLVLHEAARPAEAQPFLERALALRQRLLGDDHVHVANARKNLAALLLEQGETAAAGELLEPALRSLRTQKPAGDWTLADAESVWGAYMAALGRLRAAEGYLTGSYLTLRKLKGEEDVFTRKARRRLTRHLGPLGRDAELASDRGGPRR